MRGMGKGQATSENRKLRQAPKRKERPTIIIWTVLSAAWSVTTLPILESARTPIQSLKSITSATIA